MRSRLLPRVLHVRALFETNNRSLEAPPRLLPAWGPGVFRMLSLAWPSPASRSRSFGLPGLSRSACWAGLLVTLNGGTACPYLPAPPSHHVTSLPLGEAHRRPPW